MFSSLRSLIPRVASTASCATALRSLARPVSTSLLRSPALSFFPASSSFPSFCRRPFSTDESPSLPYSPSAFVTFPAPSFRSKAVVNGQIVDFDLQNYQSKWVVLLFYPLDFTFVCPTELIAFSERAKEFHALGAEVVAISVDSHFSHLAWVNTKRKEGGLGKMNIPLVADLTKAISADYGVLLPEQGIALRGLFIIDPKGILRQATINDLPVGRSVDETLRLIQAFQHVEKHGEVCPANWKPGHEAMKADPHGAKEYFQKQKD